MSIDLIPIDIREKIDKSIAKYPEDKKKSAVKAALYLMQDYNNGWLSVDLIDAVAEYLEIMPIEAYEVATFYNMFDLEVQGKYKLSVCTNISCMLRGSYDILSFLEQNYDLKPGGISKDGRFSLKEVECIAACGSAPAVMVNCDYHYEINTNNIEQVLAAYE